MNAQIKLLLDSVRNAVDSQNWLAGLALTLTLPDICASIQYPDVPKRYNKWWSDNFEQSYRYGNAPNDYVTGAEVYCLRCAYLHQGGDVSDPDQVKENEATIDRFTFAVSDNHLKKDGTRILLNVRTFCLDMCKKVKKWDEEVLSKGGDEIQKRASELLRIYVFERVIAKVEAAGFVSPGLVRACAKCGNTFPGEEHDALCGVCRPKPLLP
jgi:hypothetical protein